MQITISDQGAIAGALLYRLVFSAHRFRGPHIITIGYLTFSNVIAGALWYSIRRPRGALEVSRVTRKEHDSDPLKYLDK
jgi:hypothetical protein